MPNSSNPSIAQSFTPGDKLAGCYTLKEILPPQGFCVVWLAHDEELNKDIVLHFVPDSVAADPRAMTELKQEAKRNRQLIHPRIVRVHDLVEGDKWAAVSMDHVQGETLASLQKKRPKNAFNPSDITAGINELCQTLEDAHRIDLFHRDLTPENLLATGNGLMIEQFGLSRVILDSLARGGQSVEGFRDVAYMSPQQLDAERPSRADDIYSLGATLYDLLTGAPPFAEGDPIPQIRQTVPPLVSERRAAVGIEGEPMPPAWDEAIAACLAKNPDDRPKSAAEAGVRFTSGKSGSTRSAVAAAAAAAIASAEGAAASAQKEAAQETSAAKDAPKTAPDKEPAAKQTRRPWGAGKTPVIAEATVISKTAVPKPEPGKEQASAASTTEPAAAAGAGGSGKKGGPTTPTGFPLRAFVGVEGEGTRPKRKSAAGLIAVAAVFVLIVIVCLLIANRNTGSAPDTSAVANAGASATPEATAEASVSPVPGQTSTGAAPVNLASNSSPAPSAEAGPATPAPAESSPTASPSGPAPAPPVVGESPAPNAPSASVLASMSGAQGDQLLADKTKALNQAKAALADAEKAAATTAAAQAQAAAAIQDLQAAIKHKTDAAATAKKAADAAAATLKQQQETLQKAEADAAEAQKAAAAKVQAANQIRKAVQDAQAATEQQQTAQQQAEADAAALAKSAADRKKAADDAAKAAADAQKARIQQAQALAQAESDLAAVQAGLQQAQTAAKARKAAEDAARLRQQREAETARLTAQAAAAAKAAEDAQKALDAAKKAVADAEKAQRDAEQQAEAARNGALPMASPAGVTPESSPAPSPESAPSASPSSAAATPAPSAATPTLSVRAPNPHLKVDQALSNSLGMRFAPVGKVFFSIWLTRVQDFAAFAKATGFKNSAWRDPGFKQAPDHPVVNVSWNDANQFCLWLTEKEHREGILSPEETYRLPTDLEWSNAVGLPPEAGRTPEVRDMDVPDVYPWGTQWPPPPGAGNYTGEETDSDVAIKGYNDGFAWTSPVGSFNPNKFGLYDMGGNVWEWCMDWWNPEQKAKVLRGASWYNGALKLSLLSSCRIHAAADDATDNYGFRVIIAQEITKEKGGKHHSQ